MKKASAEAEAFFIARAAVMARRYSSRVVFLSKLITIPS